MGRNADKKKNFGSKGQHRKSGNLFLEKNRLKKGIVETKSGLQYEIISYGEGQQPLMADKVTIEQRVLLINGKVIADTYKSGEQATFMVSEAVEGLQEGLLLMNEGSRYKFYLPPELAWGEKGSKSSIPPNAVMIFDVKLIRVEY